MLVIDASTIPAYAVAVNVLAMACVTAGTIYQKRLVKEGDLRAPWQTLQYVGALIVTVPAAVALENLHVDGASASLRRLPGLLSGSRWARLRCFFT